MQIQPPMSAASAASIAAQSNTKDATSTAGNSGAANSAIPTDVEQSQQSNEDRDAQGQGDGLGDRGGKRPATKDEAPQHDKKSTATAPTLPGQPPSRLDVIG